MHGSKIRGRQNQHGHMHIIHFHKKMLRFPDSSEKLLLNILPLYSPFFRKILSVQLYKTHTELGTAAEDLQRLRDQESKSSKRKYQEESNSNKLGDAIAIKLSITHSLQCTAIASKNYRTGTMMTLALFLLPLSSSFSAPLLANENTNGFNSTIPGVSTTTSAPQQDF